MPTYTKDKPKLKPYKTVRALLNDPKRWTKTVYARTSKYGFGVNAHDPRAGAFCLMGAVYRVYGHGLIKDKVCAKLGVVIRKLYPTIDRHMSIMALNDRPRTTHAMIKRVLRKAGV